MPASLNSPQRDNWEKWFELQLETADVEDVIETAADFAVLPPSTLGPAFGGPAPGQTCAQWLLSDPEFVRNIKAAKWLASAIRTDLELRYVRGFDHLFCDLAKRGEDGEYI
jgi:hypothetical protein